VVFQVLEQQSKRVLVVDDELNQREAVARMIERWGFATETAANGSEALEKLRVFNPDAIVTDMIMPGMDGVQLLEKLREEEGDRAPAVIVLTGYGSIETAISTVHDYGAFWFVEKPLRPRAFRVLLERAVAQRKLDRYSETLERQLSSQGVLGKLTGQSKAMQEVFFLIRQAAPTRTNILITGESGTGKELVARAIHDGSPRRSGPFVAMNCAALPEALIESELFGHERGAFTGALTRRPGCFELAQGGTLLLDEIGDMPLGLQSKLLRVLESRSVRRLGASQEFDVDVRVVSSTNQNLQEQVAKGQFREDLFFRLSVFQIPLPPLRDRLDDIPLLSEAIIRDLNVSHGSKVTSIHPEVLDAFSRYGWPGNVRELRNVLERAIVFADEDEVLPSHLPKGFAGLPDERPKRTLSPVPSVMLPVGTTLEQAEREMIQITLTYTRNNRSRAAEMLGIDPKTLYNKLKGPTAPSGE
jgi:DNA-binding NtrC family response regulator